MKQKTRDIFKDCDFSLLGQSIVDEAKRICHQRHLVREFDPSWRTSLQMAQKIVIPKFMNVKRKEAIRMEMKQQQKAAREQKLREVEGRELEINRDCDSVYALTQKS
jgi:hypothetical protein